MVIDVLVKYLAAPIECIEVHVESINLAISTIVYNYGDTGSATCLPCTVRFDPIQPCRVGRDIVVGCEVDVIASESIQ